MCHAWALWPATAELCPIDPRALIFGVIAGRAELLPIEPRALICGFIIGDVDTEVHFSSGNKRINKDIDIRIERVIEDGEDLTNVVVRGNGDITREELEKELERMLEKQGIDKSKTKLKVEMEINS